MTDKEQKNAAKKFAEYWRDKGYEKGESQPFWLSLLRDVYGVSEPEKFISFEEQAHIDTHTGFIDGYIHSTKVMIEQKGLGKDLKKAIRQSDGSLLNPFQQAKRYITELPVSRHPRWVITCNFEEFLIYDMEKPNCEPEQIFLKDLPKEYYRLNFLTDTGDENIKKEMEVSLQAGELVGKLYNAVLKQYKNPDNPESLKSLNMLCVRLVFCLYAEDAGIFGRHNMFHDYLKEFEIKDVRRALIDLFKILDTKAENRDPYLEGTISEFPYVNGGLFADENIEIPNFDEEIVALLLNNASMDFDWSAISPTIFGAVFESTLNPETRRSGGMHYTSIENIHKVIDPLFLDDLKKELEEIKTYKQTKTRNTKLLEFQDKMSSLKFLDPACGSGNFLTETYISLRRLENEAIKMRQKDGQIEFDLGEIIKVSIGQFYGIEINDFAVSVAKTALWIAESQMMHETEEIVHMSLNFLPLKSYANIVEGNALRIPWESVVPKNEVDFIMGNPPFCGRRYRTPEQIKDVEHFFKYKDIDYVACWYKKAAKMILDSNIECTFVSTNSITQSSLQQYPITDI
ncbi:MAG: N-6 DNA methylase [Oscillospiraceae bacterium]|nr:N-6 DNA methylase [Oscillospiraceae bacterium]